MMSKTGQERPLSDDDVRELLAAVREQSGHDFSLEGTFGGGDGPGAYRLGSPQGPAVLKFLEGRHNSRRLDSVRHALDELRGRGVPVPRYINMGETAHGTYLIQEQLPGKPIGPGLGPDHVPGLLEINDLQAGLVVEPSDTWPAPVADPVIYGGDGYCLHETMRRHSPETSALLDRLQSIVATNIDRVDGSRDDIVHFDFTGANILAEQGRITGVIDWEAATTGDRAFDLVALQFYVFEEQRLREPLWSRALDLSGPAALNVYFAHMILRQVEWSARFYQPETTDHYLEVARAILFALDTL